MTILEVGPSTVRRLSSVGEPVLDGDRVAQALAGIDDTTVLLDERPVTVESLWRNLMSSGIGNDCEPVTLLHPSWWPQRWVARIVDAATTVTPEVVAQPRSSLIGRRFGSGAATVVELGDEVVAVCRGANLPRIHCRPVDAAVIAAEAGADRSEAILIDVPHGVPGGAQYGHDIRKALLDNGVTARIVRIEDAVASSTVAPPTVAPVRRRRLSAEVAAAVVVGIVVWGVGVATTRPPGMSAAGSDTVGLVEGRVTVRIPIGWTVTRVTAGPGSRRVEITSPADDSAALHVTQSYTPEETLGGAAQVLRRALAKESAGTFVEFNPADERAGRSAVTYREVRGGRDVRWSVVVDGSTRISIGCQSAPGREDTINHVCDEAIRSAHEVGGTPERS
jgi:type VII secretion-associated protein (TIGR03931 family)